MRLIGGFALVIVGALALPRVAVAGEPEAVKEARFETIAQGAMRVDRGGLAGMLWALTASCDQGDDLARRQCRAVRTARAARFVGKRLIVRGDAAALTVGAYDAKKTSAPLQVSGCIACVEPIKVGDRAYYIASKKETIHETTRAFKNEEASVQWRTNAVPRLVVEMVVEVPASPLWKRDGKEGLAVDVVGFRVFDPCDGGIISASPKSGTAAIDKAACGENAGEGSGEVPRKSRIDATPEELTASQIKSAMAPIRDAADACFMQYGVAGDSKLHVTVAADGAVIAVETRGDFAGTPTGTCVEKAVKAVSFPRTRKSRQSFNYPIVLR